MHYVVRKLSQVFNKHNDNPHDEGQQAPGTSVPTNNDPSSDAGIPLNDTPSRNSQPNDIPRNILAFRTITTILAHIQQEKQVTISDEQRSNESMSDEQRKELKISTALSNVAIAEYDIVAVVTRRNSHDLGLVACTQLPGKDPATTPSDSASKLFQQWGLVFTQNFRKDDGPNSMSGELNVIDAQTQADLEIGTFKELEQYLVHRWSRTSLAKHLYILSRILSLKDSPNGMDPEKLTERLIRYVIATCHPKMLHRLKDTLVSQSYTDSLKRVKEVKLDQFQQERGSETEIKNDRLFLTHFLLPAHFHGKIKTIIPNILVQAQLAKGNKAFQLYTMETAMEFHHLLLELLARFQENLQRMYDIMYKIQHLESGPAKAPPNFEHFLVSVMLDGRALQKLAKGAALWMHLKTITTSLSDQRGEPVAGQDKELGEMQDERDEDLEAVHPSARKGGAPVPLWKSYRDWLRLILVYFDAVDILVQYVVGPNFPFQSISLQILVTPPVDRALLPWRELFTSLDLFPTHNPQDPHSVVTNDDILKFLEASTSLPWAVIKNDQDIARAAKKGWAKRDFTVTLNHVKQLKSSKLPGWPEYAGKLVGNLDDWKKSLSEELYRAIDKSIESLCDRAHLFLSLSDGRGFGGTLHCESCLASLLNHLGKDIVIDSKYEDILTKLKDFGRTIGVSKLCCPACRYFLALLTAGTGRPFLVRGSHNTVTACTLPTWVPAHIVNEMNRFFGAQLRRELIELMGRSELIRNRLRSTGSQRLSSDSLEGRGGGSEQPFTDATFREAGALYL